MKTYLVTGACGFIGWRVSEKLLEKGAMVIGIDNLNDYYTPLLKRWRLKRLKEYKDFIFHKLDISDFNALRKVFEKERIDAIINLAARAGVRASLENPWVYLDSNVIGTLNLLECARRYSVKKVIIASTSSLYSLSKTPFSEDLITDRPLAPYGATKKAAEVLGYTYHYLYGMDIIIPRYFTVYGPAGRPDMSYYRFIQNIYRGVPVPVYGDGKQLRDFTYIDDIASGTIKCLSLKGYEIINLGGDRPVELVHLIKLIEGNLGKKAIINFFEMHKADVPATWADITKAKNLLKWRPLVSIEKGISRTVKWFLENKRFLKIR